MITLEENILLAPFTSFHIGGPAQFFARIRSTEDLTEAIQFARTRKLPIFVLGGGSNLLIADTGIRGLVLRMEDDDVVREGRRVIVGAGAPLMRVVSSAASAGLQGIEVLAGIPGSVGGAVRGNAGAFGTDIGAHVVNVTAFHQGTFEVKTFTHEDCRFSYRDSFFKQHPEWVVLGAELELSKGDAEHLQKIADETVAKREAKHPQAAWCAGSFFVNPVVTDAALRKEFETDTGVTLKDDKIPAGWLIDHVGLRGKQVGGAQVSPIHPNYLVNTGTAKAEDVIILASLIKQKIRTELNIQLKEEAQLVGF